MNSQACTSIGGWHWRAALLCSVAAGALLSSSSTARADRVDTELLLLIDISGSINDKEFDLMMGSYARAMTSSSVLDAIQSGATGSIAAAVVFWAGADEQQVGVSWMKISDLASANRFAGTLSAAGRPFSGKTALANAMNFAVPLFGKETGGPDNGFQSTAQIMNVSGDGVDNASGARVRDRSVHVDQARDAALAAGVEMINGLALNDNNGTDRTDAIKQYYAAHVIGGGTGGTEAFVEYAEGQEVFEDALVKKLQAEASAGARNSLSVVPEPATSSTAAVGLLALVLRRRRVATGK
jgi:hypothetical protein